MHLNLDVLRMRKLAIWLLTAFSMLLFAGCGEYKKTFNEAYDKAFIEGWRSSFIKSCVGNDDSKLTVCTCVADKSIASLSVEQLKDVEVIKEKILPQCR